MEDHRSSPSKSVDGTDEPTVDSRRATIKGSDGRLETPNATDIGPKRTASTDDETESGAVTHAEKTELRDSKIMKKSHTQSPGEYENIMKAEIINPTDITVTFDDIGALDEIKETLDELIMLPLQRPDLFKLGKLIKGCRGILLFGPPRTGKTMLAKAIAKEAKANFINFHMSAMISNNFGESEKIVQALFTLAARISPTIIFIDEIDGIFMRKAGGGYGHWCGRVKNEFMTHWDGLGTKQDNWVLVLGATNRPFDLDGAILRRFERRIMVGLPTVKDRERILFKMMENENVQQLDLAEIATMTEGYTGGDLRILCTAAAYRPLKELIEEERKMKAEQNHSLEETTDNGGSKGERLLTDPRPLNMEDFRQAMKKVPKSVVAEGYTMKALKRWTEFHGEGGGCSKEQEEQEEQEEQKEQKQLSYYV